MIALEDKGLQYESRQIEFSSSEYSVSNDQQVEIASDRQPVLKCLAEGHKTSEVLTMNPRGQVPVLRDGNTIVNESLAALQYLEKVYPEPCLVPKGSAPQVSHPKHCCLMRHCFLPAFAQGRHCCAHCLFMQP